jgi:hypothetical protein
VRKYAAIILVLEGLVLVIVIAVFLAGENDRVDQPTNLPVGASVTAPVEVSIPVSVNVKTLGTVTTAAFATRGGRALPTP